MANKDTGKKEEKKLPAADKTPKLEADKKEKKKDSAKWHAIPPSKRKCLCTHSVQDKLYGVDIRLHSRFKNGHRCTVCGSEKLA